MLPNLSAITLLGHSGVGKTTLSTMLAKDGWFHYSGDFRIATRYLNEAIDNWLLEQTQALPIFSDLISKNAISIKGKVSIEQLAVISAYIGKIGRQGMSYDIFLQRQKAFMQAEKCAMYDIEQFMPLAQKRYGMTSFNNDAGGSLGEYLDDAALMNFLAKRTLIVYLDAGEELQAELERRAVQYPKPICYDTSFLQQMIETYAQESAIAHPDDFDSDDFLRFVGPKLLRHRRHRYSEIAKRYGISLPVEKVWACKDAGEFAYLLTETYHKQRGTSCH
ncbi:deoxynucleoside kinase [Suttonella ornithocola]|uniref:Uncharacterized protein n=1 Tax=Suttonella ornithocola TaxID=279832 RepID=A0A380MXM1_9GAMM|nr:deoxynucleoside kinase [Suttonella ornithocola]SUO96944.1 Uncharacterised protein [Suttonella ornithocola]